MDRFTSRISKSVGSLNYLNKSVTILTSVSHNSMNYLYVFRTQYLVKRKYTRFSLQFIGIIIIDFFVDKNVSSRSQCPVEPHILNLIYKFTLKEGVGGRRVGEDVEA